MSRNGTQDKGHLLALDGARGLAVLSVMFFHFFQRESFNSFAAGRVLQSLSHMGQSGVDLFFVLSGFLITGILWDSKGSPHYFRNFYGRRILRIFPLYYASLVFFYFMAPFISSMAHFEPLKNQMWAWLYAVNIHSTFLPYSTANVPGHFWSLSVEEHFYFVWPAIVLLCNRRQLFGAAIACIAIAMASRVGLQHYGFSVFSFTLCRLDALAIGAMLALLVRSANGFASLSALRPRWWLAGLLIAVAPLWIRFSGAANPLLQVVKFSMVALMYGALVAALLDPAKPMLGRIFSNPFLRTFGKYSYGLYVWDGMLQSSILAPIDSPAALSRFVQAGIF